MKYILALFACLGFIAQAHAADLPGQRHFFEVSVADAEAAVARALESKNAAPKIEAKISGKKTGVLYDYHRPLTLDVKTLTYDEKTGRFNANLYMMSEQEVVSAMPITGKFHGMVEAPVLRRLIKNGEVIEATDLDFATFPTRQTRADTILDPDALIGKSPRRSISPARMVRIEEISEPMILEKNSVVKMLYRTPGMEISTSGIALENGAKGDVITVRNINSKQVIRAVVAENNQVHVSSGMESAQLVQGGGYATY